MVTYLFEEEVGILCMKRMNSDERSDADELWEGGVFSELWEGGELRTEELGIEEGCNVSYAAFCA